MIDRAERRRSLLRKVADKIVRKYAVAALLSCGLAFEAQALSSLEEIDDDERRGRAHALVSRVTSQVLEQPLLVSDHALEALIAAREALAIAGVEDPTDAHLQELVDAAAIAAGRRLMG